MNNLNDPQDWNIRPDPDGSRWNYALLVPMLSLAAFRWIWSRESRREVQEAKLKYEQSAEALRSELELRFLQAVQEKRRDAAQLELELEKERQRTRGFRQAVTSQARRVVEERRGLRVEREALEAEKERLLHGGVGLLQQVLKEEEPRELMEAAALEEVERGLVERQRVFCSRLVPRSVRLQLEEELLGRAGAEPRLAALEVEAGLRDVFRNDRSCAAYLNTDVRRNGSLMWLYLRYWQLQISLQTHRRAHAALLDTPPETHSHRPAGHAP